MANTFSCLRYHIVFGTKHRQRWFRLEDQERLWAYLGGIALENGLMPLLIGGVEDHVHLLLGIPPAISVSQALQQVKGGSSGWIKHNLQGCGGFSWQDGYGAFTVSKSQEEQVKEYIRKQREHHRVKTFQEEYRALLVRHGLQFEERYLWD